MLVPGSWSIVIETGAAKKYSGSQIIIKENKFLSE